jgi:hypothetical protein
MDRPGWGQAKAEADGAPGSFPNAAMELALREAAEHRRVILDEKSCPLGVDPGLPRNAGWLWFVLANYRTDTG